VIFSLFCIEPPPSNELPELNFKAGSWRYLGPANGPFHQEAHGKTVGLIGYGHIAIAVPDAYAVCDKLAAEGVKIPRPAGPMKHGGSVIAFIEDPDGYKIELIQK
jgi:lactoylglutathione lyase